MLEDIIKQRMEDLKWLGFRSVSDYKMSEANAIAKSLGIKPCKVQTREEIDRVIEECKTALMNIAIKHRKPEVPSSTPPEVIKNE